MAKTLLVVLQQILICTTHKRAERLVFLCVAELRSLLRPLRAESHATGVRRGGINQVRRNNFIAATFAVRRNYPETETGLRRCKMQRNIYEVPSRFVGGQRRFSLSQSIEGVDRSGKEASEVRSCKKPIL